MTPPRLIALIAGLALVAAAAGCGQASTQPYRAPRTADGVPEDRPSSSEWSTRH